MKKIICCFTLPFIVLGCRQDKPDAQPAPGKTFTNTIGMKFVYIEPGTFLMGSETGTPEEEPVCDVRISTGYWMGVTEVTQSQWERVMGTKPWSGKGDVREGVNYPAVYMSWQDAVEFCRKISALDNSRQYRLPTEAEWEYACRAGTRTRYSFGDNRRDLGRYAWYDGNALDIGEKYSHEVGQKYPNPWGLYDMHGNVWELCLSKYELYPYQESDGLNEINDANDITWRVVRGGSWDSNRYRCRSAIRGWVWPDGQDDWDNGFRVVALDLN